ncbi:hypothetical protein Ethha_2490 [Ethanoligenens harbinense YUAN-3]|uniref:Uncharacterized protein n=1 Tax=Ethanoligenens harbinense (strain DSM 18485 / JCM 12961 / CGMCC 1.5033 / YUAN-3) TaxID=663278 RepID=E6U5W6_ETHHY|nr:hypothetical protein Ethha_2490 [Ethanoligenens harbinense YUAN-3]AVQ97009.1 hypothetical protein CXQ68_12775 [Ethanoligenens harbinense YUAN-3]AYF39670.1 hypothetical protein CXP51_12675 [Ethanoligenens harbinense]AYF42501.1 hypothetical protein CN246_13245 [Ethanoligenens harbinense]QCN93251.1 hypothetical protein DRA42_12820 [Ethanoligenens harbinense]
MGVDDFILIFSSVIIFVGSRIIVIGINILIDKLILKGENNSTVDTATGYSLLFAFYLLYTFACIFAFIFSVSHFAKHASDLSLFVSLVVCGLVYIFWCYFQWSNNYNIVPTFDRDKKRFAFKKLCAYSTGIIITLLYGYNQIESSFYKHPTNLLLSVVNYTFLASLISFDAIFSQIHTLFEKPNEN